MLKITPIGAAQAKNYYAKDDYYTRGELAKTEALWLGKGAAALGLSGAVDKDDFQTLLEGQTPQGDFLQAKKIDPSSHRAGYDLTFSADKSVSFAALVMRDERVIQAHDQAVKQAIAVAEDRYAQARVWEPEKKAQKAVATGNVIAAVFRHETSRNLDPQLHSHAVLLNGTQLKNRSWRALHVDGIFEHKKLIQTVYHNELAYSLRQAGYEIEKGKEGSCKIKGINEQLLNEFSSRRREIEAEVKKQVEAGRAETGALYERAALSTRNRKEETPRTELLEKWETMARSAGIELPQLPKSQEINEPVLGELIEDSITHAAERETVFERSKVELFALEQQLGKCNFSQLQAGIDGAAELVEVGHKAAKYTTHIAIERERETNQLMRRGKELQLPICTNNRVAEICPANLTPGQRQGIELLLTTSDRVIAWQGVAGAGKTSALAIGVREATVSGYQTRCFAPSAEAAKELGGAIGCHADTVASLLISKDEAFTQPQLWVIDEAGLLGAKDAHALLQKAERQNARVVLVGDTRQLSAVEAGNPFKSLQAAGMATAYLEESLRQKNQTLKEAVNYIAQGSISRGYTTLETAGLIHQSDRVAEDAAQQYLSLTPAQRAKTLVIAGTNAARLETLGLIRAGLQAAGQLGQDCYQLRALRSRDLSEAQTKYAANYIPGDVIVPIKDLKRQQLKRGQQYEVIGVDIQHNRLSVQSQSGQQLTIAPERCAAISLYEQQHFPVALHEELRWTRNDRAVGRRNGQTFRLLEIDGAGHATIKHSDGSIEQTTLAGRQFVDSSLVSTTYGSQGKTADRVIAIADGRISREAFYVATSRAKHQLDIYCVDRARFAERVQQSQANENPSDYLDLFTYKASYAKDQMGSLQSSAAIGNLLQGAGYGADGGQRLGASARDQLAAALWCDRPDASANSLARDDAAQINRSLATFNRSDPVTRNDVAAVAVAVAEFVERRGIKHYQRAIGNAFDEIAQHIQALADLSRAVAERDLGAKPTRLIEESPLSTPQLTEHQDPQQQWASQVESLITEIWQREQAAKPELEQITFGKYQIQLAEGDALELYRSDRQIFGSRQGHELEQEDVQQMQQLNLHSKAAAVERAHQMYEQQQQSNQMEL